MKFNGIDWVAYVLVLIGALNWGLVGAFKFNLVEKIFGDMTVLARIIYVLVGLAALYLVVTVGKLAKSDSILRD
jgi:uncharacterized membrane protein YuzA (DUF378 family)